MKKATPAQIRALECIRDHGTLARTIAVILRNKWAKATKKGWKLTDEGRLQIFRISG